MHLVIKRPLVVMFRVALLSYRSLSVTLIYGLIIFPQATFAFESHKCEE